MRLSILLLRENERASITRPACQKGAHFVIPSEARNLSSVHWQEEEERFLASLGMTKSWIVPQPLTIL
jgi:hypothetical protein